MTCVSVRTENTARRCSCRRNLGGGCFSEMSWCDVTGMRPTAVQGSFPFFNYEKRQNFLSECLSSLIVRMNFFMKSYIWWLLLHYLCKVLSRARSAAFNMYHGHRRGHITRPQGSSWEEGRLLVSASNSFRCFGVPGRDRGC